MQETKTLQSNALLYQKGTSLDFHLASENCKTAALMT